ncbi:MAG: hypothetical protein H7Z43_09015 [Clostridia bacterium]|nr:hypothetical protein [Deltaproteobacteria bacterium]
MRRLFIVFVVASVACGTNSSNAGTPQPAPPATTGSGYQDATPLSQTSMDAPVGATTSGTGTGSPATVGSQFSTTGTAPIVRNDVVRAREQALQSAFKSAVSAAATQINKTVNNDILNHARSYVARYKITGERNEPGTSYTIDIDAEVDTDKLKDATTDGSSDAGTLMGSTPNTGVTQANKGSVRTVLLTVTHVRRARDLKAVAELLRADNRVREVRQQLYKQQRAILEVDISGTGEDVALIIEPFQTEDGVTIVIDKRTENEVDSSLKLPL